MSRLRDVVDATVSHAAATGLFDKVNGHEPKSAPTAGPRGLTCAVWADQLRPSLRSGLDSTTVVLELNVRLFMRMLTEPQDAIDPAMLEAVDTLCGEYVGDFTLGGLVKSVDVRGADGGTMLSARAGYVQQDGAVFRVMTIIVPCVVNDFWPEAP